MVVAGFRSGLIEMEYLSSRDLTTTSPNRFNIWEGAFFFAGNLWSSGCAAVPVFTRSGVKLLNEILCKLFWPIIEFVDYYKSHDLLLVVSGSFYCLIICYSFSFDNRFCKESSSKTIDLLGISFFFCLFGVCYY